MKKTIFLTASLVCCNLFTTAQRHYSLEQILDSALHNNIAVRSARYDIEAARQQRKEAFTKYFPGISAGGFIFNTNNGMAKLSVNPAEVLPADISMTLAQILPSGVLAAMGTPITMTMLKNGMVGSVMATQPVFTGGRIVYGNRLARVGEDVSRLQMQLSENNVEKTAESYFWRFLLLYIQSRYEQESFTVSTFLFPIIGMLYLVHSNPYDMELGAVSARVLEDMVRYNYEKGVDLVMMSLYLRP